MPKYKDVFNEMVEQNQELFDSFTEIHAKYDEDSASHQEEFNQVGKEVKEVVRHYEGILCGKSERGKYAKYSGNLADKFQAEIKKKYPLYDFIGVKITKIEPETREVQVEDPFNIQKISLSD